MMGWDFVQASLNHASLPQAMLNVVKALVEGAIAVLLFASVVVGVYQWACGLRQGIL